MNNEVQLLLLFPQMVGASSGYAMMNNTGTVPAVAELLPQDEGK